MFYVTRVLALQHCHQHRLLHTPSWKHLPLVQSGILDKPDEELWVARIQRLSFCARFWVPKHQAPLRPICETLLYCQVAHQHRPHHVGSWGVGRRLVLWMPIPSHVQEEEALRAGVATDQQRPSLVEPTIPAGATRAHAPFDLQCVVTRFGNPADKSPIPPISVPYFIYFLIPQTNIWDILVLLIF